MLGGMTYPGGKNGAGVYQTIINLMPPHETYIEPFLGSGAIMRLKKPAKLNIGLDLDSAVIARMREHTGGIVSSGDRDVLIAENGDAGHHRPIWRFERSDALAFLRTYKFCGAELVYCDPPYMHETRVRRDLYKFEMTDAQHRELLRILKQLPCRVMISGYFTKLYAQTLRGWEHVQFPAYTRRNSLRAEWLWFNFERPLALHDYRFLGRDFRERERIKRKTLRWSNRIRRMPGLERRALLHALELASPNP